MSIPSGWHYDTPGSAWEEEWRDAQSRGPTGSEDGVTYYRSGRGSEFALDNQTDTSQAGWGSRGVPTRYQNLLASAGPNQRGLLHGRNIYSGSTASPTPTPTPTPTPRPTPRLDTARIEAAQRAAAPFVTAYESGRTPVLQTAASGSGAAFNPYAAASQYAADANDAFTRMSRRNHAVAMQQAEEMGASLRYQAQAFNGAVPRLENWRNYYNTLRDDIMNA